MWFYWIESSKHLELSTLLTHIKVYKQVSYQKKRLGCRSKISITTFFQIWIRSIQNDFIAIFLSERFYTRCNENRFWDKKKIEFRNLTRNCRILSLKMFFLSRNQFPVLFLSQRFITRQSPSGNQNSRNSFL